VPGRRGCAALVAVSVALVRVLGPPAVPVLGSLLFRGLRHAQALVVSLDPL